LTVKYDLPKENLIQYFKHNKHNKAIVLDNDNSVMGIIYTDDIIALIEESSINNIYAFAAVEKEEDVLDSFLTKIKHRWKWLALNLLTAFIAAGVVSLFDATISKYVLLAVYMPIVAGMGGNAGSQTMAVMVRGLTLKEVDLNNAKRVIVNELLSGLGNGLIIGLIVSIVLSLFNQNFVLGIILGISMIINLGIAVCLEH
jgi:magnesium transporter